MFYLLSWPDNLTATPPRAADPGGRRAVSEVNVVLLNF